jgi:hypothetical protein
MNVYDLILVDAYVKLNRVLRETKQNLKWIERDEAVAWSRRIIWIDDGCMGL